MTRGRRLQTRLPYAALAAALLFAIGVALAVPAPAARAATPTESAWRVVWIDGSRIYMATRDTVPLDPGQPVTFLQSRKTLASGEVEQMLDRALAVVRLESGSLSRVKVDRLSVRLDERTLAPRPLLRLGVPGRRANALFSCSPDTLVVRGLRDVYVVLHASGPALDLVRRTPGDGASPWPDTLRVRPFASVVDEEIALERGELDAAVFGPGEASPHLRALPRWGSALFVSNGLLVATRDSRPASLRDPIALTHDDYVALQSMGLETLRGDLQWQVTAPEFGYAYSEWRVSRDCPGHDAIQRTFDDERRRKSASPQDDLQLEYVRGDRAPDGALVLASVLCPIVSDATWRPYLRALGPDLLEQSFTCLGSGR